MNCRPTVMLNYNMVFRLSPTTQVGSWGFDATVLPDLFQPLAATSLGPTGIGVSTTSFLNPGLRDASGVTSFASMAQTFSNLGIEAHRLTYMGVTAYQDGPALADQGTLCASQQPVARIKVGVGCPPGLLTTGFSTQRAVRYQPSDFPNYEASQLMPNAYFGESKAGCYMPLRLDGDFRFITDADREWLCQNWAVNTPDLVKTYYTPVAGTSPITGFLPYPGAAQGAWTVLTAPRMVGDQVFKPLNATWGSISARNLAVTTSFAFYVRMGIECLVAPSSVFAPQQKMSIPYDPVAIASYFRISRELKDAYPSDHNDLGKIWDVIKNVAKVALPVIGGFGPYGAAAAGIGNGIMSIVDNFAGNGTSSPGGAPIPPQPQRLVAVPRGIDQPPLAQVERARTQQMVRDSTAVRRRIGAVGRKKTKKRVTKRY